MRFKKYLPLSIILLTAIGLFFITRYALEKWKDAQMDAQHDLMIGEIMTHSNLPTNASFETVTDLARDFVHDNSQHNMDAEFYSHWPDRTKLTNAFLDGLQGERKDLPHMECSTRSNLLSDILEQKGLDTRNVVLYSPDRNLANHRLIEVRDPKTGQWHAQDATHNAYWRHKATKERADFMEIVAAPDNYEPCTEKRCGWDMVAHDGSKIGDLKNYLHIATIHDKEDDFRVTLYSDAAPPDRRYQMNGTTGTFCDFFSKNCVEYKKAVQ